MLFCPHPSPSPTLWERADKGTSLEFAACGGVRIFVALTPSPSPTAWARGVGAHGGAPCSAFPLSRLAGEGDKGGEGKEARPPVHACAGKNSPCFKDFVPNRCTLIRWERGGVLFCPHP